MNIRPFIIAVMTFGICLAVGCEDEMVGAPCKAETDDSTFNENQEGTTYSIETRSVQCESTICLTKTEFNRRANTNSDGDFIRQSQTKYSFCSCRCKDLEGHTYNSNPDKYHDLCECPPNTRCELVMDALEGAPDKVTGSYCIPNCIHNGCQSKEKEICVPSSDSSKPWEWSCADRTDDALGAE